MKKIGFIGAYDKTDVILYVAKLLTIVGKRILVVDSTINQKAKYVVPVINPTKSYVTEFEEIDVAVGFDNFESIKEYLGIPKSAVLNYDIALIDTDSPEVLEKFTMQNAEQNYFVTSFDVFSLKRGLEILSGLKTSLDLTKVLFSKHAYQEEDDYLNFLSLGYKIIWKEEKVYFPFELGDQSVLKIKFKHLSEQYKEGLIYIAEQILAEKKSNIRKALKQLERNE